MDVETPSGVRDKIELIRGFAPKKKVMFHQRHPDIA
jgi:hypothetical protein